MKTWKKGTGSSFKNSDECYGESYDIEDAPLNLAIINIKSRYPKKGYLYNLEAHEIALVLAGTGSVEVKNQKKQSLSVGDIVYFKPLDKIAWYGDMAITTICSPVFDPNKHLIEDEL